MSSAKSKPDPQDPEKGVVTVEGVRVRSGGIGELEAENEALFDREIAAQMRICAMEVRIADLEDENRELRRAISRVSE